MGWIGLDEVQHKDARRSLSGEPARIPSKRKRPVKPWIVRRIWNGGFKWSERLSIVGRFATKELAEKHRAKCDRSVAGFGGKARHVVEKQ